MQQVKDFNFIDQEFIPVVSKYYEIYNVRCGLDINHAVLAVGYGHDNISNTFFIKKIIIKFLKL